MSMTYADHVYDNHWEDAADENGNIDYKKLCEIYHDAFEKYESEREVKIEKLESENRILKAKLEKAAEQIEFVVEGFVKLGTISLMGRNEILAGIKQELDSIGSEK